MKESSVDMGRPEHGHRPNRGAGSGRSGRGGRGGVGGRGGRGGGSGHRGDNNNHRNNSALALPAKKLRSTPLTDAEIAELRSQSRLQLDSEEVRNLLQSFQDGVDESKVGITAYIYKESPTIEFIYKQFCSDFIVEEIDLQGSVLQITSKELPPDPSEDASVVNARKEEMKSKLIHLIGESQFLALEEFYNSEIQRTEGLRNAMEESPADPNIHDSRRQRKRSSPFSKAEEKQYLLPHTFSKEERGIIHTAIKNVFPNLLTDLVDVPSAASVQRNANDSIEKDGTESNEPKKARLEDNDDTSNVTTLNTESLSSSSSSSPTATETKTKCIRARYKDLVANRNRDTRSTDQQWPEGCPPYLSFVLWKERIGTMDAISYICSRLHLASKLFSCAGTKDKRAVTSQAVTAFKVKPSKLASLFNTSAIGGRLDIGNFAYRNTQLTFGDLQGNRFTITLRDVRGWLDGLPPPILRQEKPAFINYYGLQRFGTGTVPSHLIGNALLRRDWQRAVELIFCPLSYGDANSQVNDVEEARRYFAKTYDPLGTLDRMPFFMKSERIILQTLLDQGPNAFSNAFQVIPRPMRTMYVHAWQSFVWNALASERMTIYDTSSPVVGDLVRMSQASENTPSVLNQTKSNPSGSDETITSTREADPTEIDTVVAEEVAMKDIRIDDSLIHVVTEEDVEKKRFSIEDIILPLPSPNVQLPKNSIANTYHDLLKSENINDDVFANSTMCHEYGLYPCYRSLITTISDLKWRFLPLVNPREPLPSLNDSVDAPPPPSSNGGDSVSALQLSFTLPTSSYATMFLREITHNSTATNPQKFKTRNIRNSYPQNSTNEPADISSETQAQES